MMALKPINNLERALEQAKIGVLPIEEMLRELVSATLYVPSETEVSLDGSGMRPLIFAKDDLQVVACFSDKSRINQFSRKAPYCLAINGGELLRRLPTGHGVVVNPGCEVGIDISPDGIKRVLRDFVK